MPDGTLKTHKELAKQAKVSTHTIDRAVKVEKASQRDARKAEAIALHDSGVTVEQIEAELGREKRTIKSYLQDGR